MGCILSTTNVSDGFRQLRGRVLEESNWEMMSEWKGTVCLSRSFEKISPASSFGTDIMRNYGDAVNTHTTTSSELAGISNWYSGAVKRIELLHSWANYKLETEGSRPQGFVLMDELDEIKQKVQKAWEEKDLMACVQMDVNFVEMEEIHSPLTTVDCLLLRTEQKLHCLKYEIFKYGTAHVIRRGALSQSDVQAFYMKILFAEVSIDTAEAQRDWVEVYKVYSTVSATVKAFQKKYRRTLLSNTQGLKFLKNKQRRLGIRIDFNWLPL